MMTSMAELSISEHAWASRESEEASDLIRYLLAIGRERGLSTSVTESAWTPWSHTLARRFQTLVATWREECAHLSSIRDMVLHPAYQQIIGMGPGVVPFILNELERTPNHWFWALRAITREDPVRPEHRGKVAAMAREWLQWAEEKGIR
jgi:hypothetical protein